MTSTGRSSIRERSASINAVALSQIYSSPFNEDKKAIAFSDSVQDASHRAGFFAARTYKFNLRMAITRYMLGKKPQSLPALIDNFIAHYKKEMGDERFFATFLDPGNEWISEIQLVISGENPEDAPVSRTAMEYVERRLAWDITAELGYMSLVGRTREKSATLAVGIEKEKLEGAIAGAHAVLTGKIGVLRDTPMSVIGRFILGFLYRLRTRGGIVTGQTFSYVKAGGDSYMLGGKDTMDHLVLPHGKFIRLPAFVSRTAYERFDVLPRNRRHDKTWYGRWARRVFADVRVIDDYIEELFDIVISSLVGQGVLREIVSSVRGERYGGSKSARSSSIRTRVSCSATGKDAERR